MFIPLNSPEGNGPPPFIFRRENRAQGELDAENCRLLFNLSMRTLGETLVDVNVTDKIVSLNLWNDHPAIADLAESSRAEVAESLNQAGYQLLSLRTTPLPKAGELQAAEAQVSTPKAPRMPDAAQFSSNRYKGVDFRI